MPPKGFYPVSNKYIMMLWCASIMCQKLIQILLCIFIIKKDPFHLHCFASICSLALVESTQMNGYILEDTVVNIISIWKCMQPCCVMVHTSRSPRMSFPHAWPGPVPLPYYKLHFFIHKGDKGLQSWILEYAENLCFLNHSLITFNLACPSFMTSTEKCSKF